MAEENKHYFLAPSAAHRWINCPGEPHVRATYPNITSEYALAGTTAHWVGALALLLEVPCADYIGKVCDETGMVVTAEMAEAAQVYVDRVTELAKDALSVHYEVKCHIDEHLGGTSDCAVIHEDRLEVVDFKYGQGVRVYAEDNEQLMIYAIGALIELKVPTKKIDKAHLEIVQPRTQHHPAPVDMPLKDLLDWSVSVLDPARKRVFAEPNTFVAGEWCFFCPHKLNCSAQRELITNAVEADFLEAPKKLDLKPVTALTLKQISNIMSVKDTIVDWLKSVETLAFEKERAKAGSIEGHKIVQSVANRTWKDEKVAAKELNAVLGKAAFTEPELISPAQAEKALKKSGRELNAELVHRPVKGLSLVPASDKRPQYSGADEDFK